MRAIKRLPKYYRLSNDLLSQGIKNISSDKLANLIDFSASQIRQDLRGLGQRSGYDLLELHTFLEKRLCLKRTYTCILIGAGNIGHSLAKHEQFIKEGFILKGIFDNDPLKINTYLGSSRLKVKAIRELDHFMATNEIDICILCTPSATAQSVTNILVKSGIKGILNFSTTDLIVPNNIIVENVNIENSFLTLTFHLKNNKTIERNNFLLPEYNEKNNIL